MRLHDPLVVRPTGIGWTPKFRPKFSERFFKIGVVPARQTDCRLSSGWLHEFPQNLVIWTFFCAFCPFFLAKYKENKGKKGKIRRKKRFRLPDYALFRAGGPIWGLYRAIGIAIDIKFHGRFGSSCVSPSNSRPLFFFQSAKERR